MGNSLNLELLTSTLDNLNHTLSDLAAQFSIDVRILFGVGIGLALIVGLFGYKMIKLLLSLSFAGVGYYAGTELFLFLGSKIDGIPAWAEYVCGGVLAVVFLCLSFAKFSYVWFGSAVLLGSAVASIFIPAEYPLLILGAALIIGLISVMLIRTTFVLTTSCIAGIVCVSFTAQLLPGWTWLGLATGGYGMWIALGIALVLALIQFTTNRYRGESIA